TPSSSLRPTSQWRDSFLGRGDTSELLKKAQQRLHFLRVLRKNNITQRLLVSFYRCSIESLLTYCICVWYTSCTVAQRKALQRVINTAQKIIGCPLLTLEELHSSSCLKKAQHIIKDTSHPGHHLLELLPSGRCRSDQGDRENGAGVSSGRRKEDKETWWWNEEVQNSIQRKRLGKKKWDMDRTEENRQEYKELQRRVKREVSKAKQKAYDELYTRLETREGEKDLYRLARQRDRDGKDVQQVRVIKDRDGRVLTSEESVQRRWKEYFEELINEENEMGKKRVEGVNSVEQEVDKIRKDEVRKALKRMKSGKAVGPDDIPVEVWKCLGEAAVEFLTSLFNGVLES
ncbi:hypothetical protein QTP86_020859, partial [Hemibagrus guttatus]